MRVAIFDVDGTLVQGSTERAFWRYLARHGKQGPRQLCLFALFLLRHFPASGFNTLKRNKAYLDGLRCDEIEALGRSWVTAWADDHWYRPAVDRLIQHQQRGDVVLLLSGTLELLLGPLAERLGVSHIRGTIVRQRSGAFVAAPPLEHPFAESKRAIAEQFIKALGVDWARVSAYADSHHDVALLEAVGDPVAVRPDQALRKLALERHWEVMEHDPGFATAQLARRR